MNRYIVAFSLVVGVLIIEGSVRVGGQSFGPNTPEAQAVRQKQLDLEAQTPKLQVAEEHLTLQIPGHTIGETEGVSMNSKGHLKREIFFGYLL